MKKIKIDLLLLVLIIFTGLFSFVVETRAEESMPVGTLLYRTSAGNKMYGYNTNIILGDDGVKSGHVAIYAGEGKILEAVNRGVVLNDLNRFINADNGEQFVGAKIPVNFSSIDEDRIESIIKFFEKNKFLYDADLGQQKGPNTREWICSGVAEKIYESLDFDDDEFNEIGDFQYNSNNYFINITPDAYEDNNIHNKELGDHFALNKEYSQINKRKPIKEKGFAVNGLGKLKDSKNYFFFPYTQFLQPGLKDVEIDVNKLTSSFDQEKIRGKSLMLTTVWQGTKNNTNNFKKEKIAGFKKVVKNIANKTKSNLVSLWNKTKSNLASIWNKTKSSLASIWNKTKSNLASIWNKTKSNLASIWNKTKSSLASLWNKTKSSLASLWNNANNFKKEKIASFKKVVKNTTNKVKTSFVSLWSKTNSIFKKNKTVIVKKENKGIVLSGLAAEIKTETKGDIKAPVPIVGDLLKEKILPSIKKVFGEKIINNEQPQSKLISRIIKVARVIDGDTIILSTGEKVRYIGIDTPELNKKGSKDDECLAWVAKVRNQDLLSRGKITLIKDNNVDKDKYGRLLRYVYVNDVFVNRVLVAEGLAETFFCEKNWKNCPVISDQTRKNIIQEANVNAKEFQRGIFSDICVKKEKDKKTEQPIEAEKNFIDTIRKIYPFNPHGFSFDTTKNTEQTKSNTEQSVSTTTPAISTTTPAISTTTPITSTTTPAISTTTPITSTTTPVISTTTPVTNKSPIVISEFATRFLGGASNEFVEIYNSSSTAIDISGWKLMKKSVAGNSWQSKTGKGLANGSIIPALGFFLFGSEEYDYVIQPDYRHTANLSLADPGGHIKIADEVGNEMDRVGYGSNAINPETSPIVFDMSLGSAERRAYATSTSQNMSVGGSHYFLGNAFDSDDNSFDFIIKDNPEPQNSHSLSEPIDLNNITPESINDLHFATSSLTKTSIELAWTAPANSNFATTSYYDIRYEEIGEQDEIDIDWNDTYYKEEYFNVLPRGEEQQFVVSNLKSGARYVFAIKAYNGYNSSDVSNQIATTTITVANNSFSHYNGFMEIADIAHSFKCEYTSDLITPNDIFAQTFVPKKYDSFSKEKLLSSFSFMIKPISAVNHSIDAIRLCSGKMTTATGTNPQADWNCDNPGQAIISDFSLSQNKFTRNLGSYQWRNFFRGTGNNWENQEDEHFIMIKGSNLSFCHNGAETDLYLEGEAVSQYSNISDFVFATFFELYSY